MVVMVMVVLMVMIMNLSMLLRRGIRLMGVMLVLGILPIDI